MIGKENIKIIFFDVDEVLLESSKATDDEFCRLLHTDSNTLSSVRTTLYSHPFVKQEWPRADTLEKETAYYRQFYQMMVQTLGQEPTEALIDDMMDIRYRNKLARTLYPGVIELLESLRNTYRLGIITNAHPSRREIEFKHLNITHYFVPIIISGEIHIIKPHRGIYHAAVKQSKIPAQHAAFVDNDILNVEGALDSGFGLGICIGKQETIRDHLICIDDVTKIRELFL